MIEYKYLLKLKTSAVLLFILYYIITKYDILFTYLNTNNTKNT